ncbi:hypothetical protein [Pseudanabaena sp. FACHB-2040]|uniref:hypothetical protein n=1 Tax=Pseudanabaena sp. FACHB-2040 TaxID=2692859 RepID=UPI0016866505|nr:hypothetical protein [Pseudanabaena sp. FACHB-2040]MBD2259346.1 hypothetical protein [Pseudanabaena sp. FACHB-2040]
MTISPDKITSTILKHDSKVTSYKIALLRAINDVVLTFPDLRTYQSDVAVPMASLRAGVVEELEVDFGLTEELPPVPTGVVEGAIATQTRVLGFKVR